MDRWFVATLYVYAEHFMSVLTEYYFDYFICPDEETLGWLLERTLETERIFFPAYFQSKGESEIYQNFGKEKTTKLCTVDAYAVLKHNTGWRQFFVNLGST